MRCALAGWLLIACAACSNDHQPPRDASDAPTDGPTIDLAACNVPAPSGKVACCGKAYCAVVDPSFVCCYFPGRLGDPDYQWCAPPSEVNPIMGPCYYVVP